MDHLSQKVGRSIRELVLEFAFQGAFEGHDQFRFSDTRDIDIKLLIVIAQLHHFDNSLIAFLWLVLQRLQDSEILQWDKNLLDRGIKIGDIRIGGQSFFDAIDDFLSVQSHGT